MDSNRFSVKVQVKNFAHDLPGYLFDIDDREQWCLDMNLDFPWIGEVSMVEDQTFLEFSFDNHQSATLFKMRWGGNV